VISTVAGYTGGAEDGPSYRSLGGHTEALLVVYDPQRVSYPELLAVFWAAHNPHHNTSMRQYRNAVFVTDPEQRSAAERSRRELEERSGQSVRTDVEPAGPFFAAEDYHQKYSLRRNATLYRELRRLYPGELEFLASTAAARINGFLAGYGSLERLRRELGGFGLSEAGREELLAVAGGMLR
jgi:methionine-S-sulfoxide reductase